jgi:hypothetical protein
MTRDERERQYFLAALERLERFEHSKPSRRLLVAMDNALVHLQKFLVRVLDARARGVGGLEHWCAQAEALIGHLKAERQKMADRIRREELN